MRQEKRKMRESRMCFNRPLQAREGTGSPLMTKCLEWLGAYLMTECLEWSCVLRKEMNPLFIQEEHMVIISHFQDGIFCEILEYSFRSQEGSWKEAHGFDLRNALRRSPSYERGSCRWRNAWLGLGNIGAWVLENMIGWSVLHLVMVEWRLFHLVLWFFCTSPCLCFLDNLLFGKLFFENGSIAHFERVRPFMIGWSYFHLIMTKWSALYSIMARSLVSLDFWPI